MRRYFELCDELRYGKTWMRMLAKPVKAIMSKDLLMNLIDRLQLSLSPM